MSLSTLTPYSPQVCSRVLPPSSPSNSASAGPAPSVPRSLCFRRVFRSTAVAATATALSQLVGCPLDVGTRANRARPAASIFHALLSVIRQKGFFAAFAGLPLHAMKRLPTKALTVALFDLGTQMAAGAKGKSALSAGQQVAMAVSSGVGALLATYPVHLAYYSVRKGMSFGTVLTCARLQPRILYSGALPGVLSTLPAVLVDYVMYRCLKKRIDEGGGSGGVAGVAMVAAATAANLTGGFFSEPFKAVSRKMAVESVRSATCGSLRRTASAMLKGGGVGEFWRGFPVRCMRYSVSAVVSKTTVQQLQGRVGQEPVEAVFGDGRSVVVAPAGRALVGGRWERKSSYRVSSGGGVLRCYRTM